MISLDDVTVLNLKGDSVPLTDLYKNGPAAVVWLRHYG
jgi:hypothetical protein